MAFPGQPPPLTPVLLAGLAARPVPPAVLQPLLDLAMAAVARRHGEVFARLDGLGEGVFLVDPVDLPFDFLLRPGASPPRLTVFRAGASGVEATATIRGSLLSLIDLLEGRVDGDALFFSRDLVFEGDTEAVLILRNAVDGAGIDLVEIAASALGPLAGLARRVLGPADDLFRRATRDLERLQGALLFPVARRCDAQAAELDAIRTGMDALQRRSRRPRTAPRTRTGGPAGAGTGGRAGGGAR
ncbi:MAG: SCP2 sterol-binding domain-containing protein [Proteobacteria bacterium]|nr:SCP2 sterol-binding domain-containing protein [Pseudomonadota bacterium]